MPLAKSSIKKPAAKLKKLVPGVTFVQKLDGIHEYKLTKNGLRILLIPDTSVPVVGCMMTYHVGSRNEAIGYTGATHLLEHLLFKGSDNFKREDDKTPDLLFDAKGGNLNASTWYDRTNYYEIIPKELLQTAIELEADRMRHANFNAKDLASEMPAVRSEFEIGENQPIQALDKQIWSIAYQAHPYHHDTIGWRSDIEHVSIDRLRKFYDDFYWPNNATITIAGDFLVDDVLKLIKKYFGVHTASPHEIPPMYTEEPRQEGERRAIVRRAGTDVVGIGHKIPNAFHADIPALIMLAEILSSGKTSRLERALVDTATSTGLSTAFYQLLDPALFTTYVMLAPGVTHETMEKLLKQEYQNIISKGVTPAELKRAKKSARMFFAHRRDGTYSLLSALNEDISLKDWSRFATLPAALESVTPKDIQRVARTYLVDDQSTVGWFVSNSA